MDKPWVPHVVRQGEHLAQIAFRAGVAPDALWGHPKNRDLAALRKNPNTLLAGDLLFVPSEPPPGLRLKKGAAHTFKVDPPRVPIRLRVALKPPLANEPFEVKGLSTPIQGKASAEGEIAFDVPVSAREVEVHIPSRSLTIPLRVGDLDPLDAQSGVIQRLRNLGYLPSHAGEVAAEMLRAALRAFQLKMGLPRSGEMDPDTLAKLEEAHGS